LLIPSINKYLLSTYYVTNIILDFEDILVNICIVVKSHRYKIYIIFLD
jgi:hypothetical protein